MKTEKIEWHFYKPLDFPCMSPGCNGQAEYKVTINEPITLNLCLCYGCAHTLSEQDLARLFLGRRRENE